MSFKTQNECQKEEGYITLNDISLSLSPI